ncbi:MAG TPA: hypothetical protein VGD37_34775 [Kofleriaceae bacterium]|jgi:hypothetical protein
MADAVVWAGEHAVVVGSAGASDPAPAGANPIFVDGARYHGWIRALDAQGGAAWARRFDDGREVHVRAAAPAGEDLVIAGEQRAGAAREYTGWVARIAPGGAERWRLDRLGAAGATGLAAIAVRADGSVVAGGMQRGKAWLVAIDPHGKQRWDHDLAGADEVTAVMPAADTVVAAGIVGRTTTSAGTSRLIAVDAAGAVRWSTELPAHGPGEVFALAPLGDGGIAVGQAPDTGGHDGAWIVRFGAGGAIRSSQVLPAAGSDAARAVAAMADGGFVVAGSSFDAPRDRRGMVWRFDAADQLLWQKAYGSGESFARGVAATPDGGAIVVGATQTPGARLRAWIGGIDRLGAPRWTAP